MSVASAFRCSVSKFWSAVTFDGIVTCGCMETMSFCHDDWQMSLKGKNVIILLWLVIIAAFFWFEFQFSVNIIQEQKWSKNDRDN